MYMYTIYIYTFIYGYIFKDKPKCHLYGQKVFEFSSQQIFVSPNVEVQVHFILCQSPSAEIIFPKYQKLSKFLQVPEWFM